MPADETMDASIDLDVRLLPPPEPMERVLDVLPELRGGGALRMIHHREPFPLYGILAQRGYAWHTRRMGEAHFEILIWHAGMG
ncbi:MAG: DUF2249 domain-containing protein [Betaproteobacteria bacterium]|nr:DUF2249 domain-containing protein [Betaproteobacteria bacterium]